MTLFSWLFQASFDAGVDFEDTGEIDPHTIAGWSSLWTLVYILAAIRLIYENIVDKATVCCFAWLGFKPE